MPSDSSDKDQPLGMTVHSMPAPNQLAGEQAARTRMGRWKMLAVLLVCASPVIASYFMYYVVRPEGRRNFGTLVEPQRPLPDMVGTSLDGGAVNLRALKGQWLLVSVSSGACGDACARHLYLQRQLRQGLGKNKDRLDWVWLINDSVAVSDALKPALKEATVLRVQPTDLAKWLEPQAEHALPEHLYLVDPLGNWMMRFPPQISPEGTPQIKRDLERLMRAAAFWDTAGRDTPK
ncbi:MAG: hypothetical protein RLZZ573_1618 [Pseudomonadota bacterium]